MWQNWSLFNLVSQAVNAPPTKGSLSLFTGMHQKIKFILALEIATENTIALPAICGTLMRLAF